MARYGLIVGVAKYKSPLGSLSKTESDAKAVNDLLKQHGDFEDIQVLTGDVTREKLEDALGRLLMERAERNEALIYFSGHAVVVKGNFGKKRGYLALSNTGLKTSNGEITWIENGIALDDLSCLIGEAKLSNLVVLLDCCHSETLLEESQGFLQRAIVSQAFAELQQDYFLVSACRKFEVAYAMKSESYSIFTGAMLRGLARDRANDRGVVDASTMFGYVAEQLRGTGQEAVSFGYGRALRIVDYRAMVAEKITADVCPYVGLEAFDAKTAKFFKGRDRQIELLLRKIEASRFVPVIGASGSGKSSLVKAGLMPALEKQGWCVLPPIKPWTDPLAILKKTLIEQFYKLPQQVKKAYARIETEGLNGVLPEGSPRVLLVVDQFEELFTVCADEGERQEFLRLLVDGADREGKLTIATTMRADFVEQALSYPALAKLIQRDRVFWLVPLEPSELREAIAAPAEMQGYELTEGLLEVICQDVESEKNSLPLLEFALTQLWEKRDRQNHRLTLTAYTEMGKLRGALDLHAKELYDSLDSDLERDWARRLFLQLVRTGQDVRDTRQRQAKQFLLEMATAEDEVEAIANLLEIFVGGRLLTSGEENNAAFVDLAHEALMEGWELFAEWRSQDRDLRRLCDRVKDAFDEYQKASDRDKFLLPEGVVAQIEEVEVAINDYLTPEQEQFVQRNRYKYKPWLNSANLPEMVDIPSGTFWMGSPEGIGNDDEKPYHQVAVKAFRMGKYPVTQAQWRTVAMSPKVEIDLSLNPSYHRGDNKPVEQVTWYEAQEFCARLSRLTGEEYRLPSEAEWEYTCRAGAKEYSEYSFGDDASQLDDYGWFGNNSGDRAIDTDQIWKDVNQDNNRYSERIRQNNCGTHPVGLKSANAWGLYDMHGNVWEWCADDWNDNYEEAPFDSQIWTKDVKNYKESGETKKLLRGGSWFNNALNCRSACRNYDFARLQDFNLGFRVVCVLR